MSVHETLQVPSEAGNTLAQRYEAVKAAAAVVADIAAIETGPDPLIEALADSHGRMAERAQGIVADMAAVLEPGIATLLAVSSRGADAAPAARALWAEYELERIALARVLGRSAYLTA